MTRSDLTAAQPRRLWLRSAFLYIGLSAGLVGGTSGCHDVMRQLGEARRLAADLRIQFNQAANASLRAVIANTTEASAGFAREAEQARRVMRNDADDLRPLLHELYYANASQQLEEFNRRFAEYEAFDRNILELAAENTVGLQCYLCGKRSRR